MELYTIIVVKDQAYQRHSNLNDLTKGIFTLPEEIIYKILDHVNQMDTIHLALTHRSFLKYANQIVGEHLRLL